MLAIWYLFGSPLVVVSQLENRPYYWRSLLLHVFVRQEMMPVKGQLSIIEHREREGRREGEGERERE